MCEQKSKFDIWDYVDGDFPSSSTCEKKCPIPSGGDPAKILFKNPIRLDSNAQLVGGQVYTTPDGKWFIVCGDNFDWALVGRDTPVDPDATGGVLSRLYFNTTWSMYLSQYVVEGKSELTQYGSLTRTGNIGVLPYEITNTPEAKNEAKRRAMLIFEVLICDKPDAPTNSKIGATADSNNGVFNMTIGYYDNNTNALKLELATVVHT